jgi:hypothetical protein
VKVPGLAVESHIDSVATNRDGLIVQRLRDVAQEVDDPAKSVVDFLSWKNGRLLDALGVVGNGGHNAAFLSGAVALVVHIAAVRWVILSVNVVEPKEEKYND